MIQAPPVSWGADLFPNYNHDDYGFVNASDTAICFPTKLAGSVTTPSVVTTNPPSGSSGRRVESFRDLYYNAVYIFPNSISVQNPTPGDEFVFRAWNARFGETETTGRTDSGDEGVINTFETGETFRALEIKDFNVSIEPLAPVNISADYIYSFDNAIDALFEFNATRAVLLNSEPQLPFRQTLSYKTDVIKALDGTEQRFSYLLAPVEQINAELVYTEESEFRELREFLFFRMDTPILLPKWYEGILGRSDYSAGDSVLNEDFSQSDYEVGDNVYLVTLSNETFELGVVSAITDTSLTLTTALQNDYTARRFYIYPTKAYLLPKNQPIERFAFNGGIIPLQLTDTSRRPLVGKGAPEFTLFNTRPVLDMRPIVDDRAADTFNNRYQLFDFGGAVRTIANQTFADITQPRTYRVSSRSEWQYWKAFLDEVSGQRKTFYAPTWRSDLVLAETPLPGSDTLVIEPTDPNYLLSYFVKNSHKQLQIITSAGTYYRAVDAVTQNVDGNYTLELNQLIPDLPGATTILSISFLLQQRLGSDEVAIDHFSNYSEITIVQRTVED